MNIAEELIKTM